MVMKGVGEPDEQGPHRGRFPLEIRRDAWDHALRLTILAGLGALAYVSIRAQAFSPLYQLAETHGISAALVRPSILWFMMGTTLLVFRTLLWFTYRPPMPAIPKSAPRMTVVIPAYNEGAMVSKAIDSIAAAHYPHDRLEIIAVDDGSKDDTWEHIQRAAARHGGRVRALRQDRNRGKREALAAGFRIGNGEVFVTVDSDSVVSPDALLALAGPFASERVGVVAGKVLVYNRAEGIIPRMLHVRFTLAFDFLRAYQSTFGTVYCSPGALSAYRASAVKKVLEQWLQQRFLGARATIGEDRALTNDIMNLGYDSIYQGRAVVLTVVPTRYRQLTKMLLRWNRSFIREELRFARIIWKRPPAALLIALCDSIITNLRYPVMFLSLSLLALALLTGVLVLPRMLVAIGLMSLFYCLYYLRSERSFDMIYGVIFEYFSFFFLFWIFPWALLTVRARGWMTR
jgi:hyaluronan synthase